ncbi:uncharacterized protein LOC127862587 [Dreissena polymorpha]|uniref:uncharacterized protein LOC127862587 n=1 Tax=Dreissena polymorpha TaxID=45954 RepID=UPI00226556B8|nr:uncharacterized protein LOC127862587 [Dreissena polymorpha]
MVRQFHDGMQAHVLDDGNQSSPFNVTNGVKQRCVLAPTFFSMMFTAMLATAFSESDPGIDIRYLTDGGVFNLQSLKANTKVHFKRLRDLLFADDCALNALTEADMQQSLNRFSDACDSFGLTISTKKTEVMFQPAPNSPYIKPNISIKSQRLNPVEKFTYLGSTLSRNVHIEDEVNSRKAKVSSAFGRLNKTVWNRRGIKSVTKLNVYRAVVLTALLYASETWTVYQRHTKKLNHFHTVCLRKIQGITWQDKIPDTEVLSRANMYGINTILRSSQLRWTGQVCRMDGTRIPKQLFYGELVNGSRSRGCQKKRFKDSLKVSTKLFGIEPDSLEKLAQNRSAWRSSLKVGAKKHEQHRVCLAEHKRAKRKEREASDAPPTGPSLPKCGRAFHTRIGLIGHLRTHNTNHRNTNS